MLSVLLEFQNMLVFVTSQAVDAPGLLGVEKIYVVGLLLMVVAGLLQYIRFRHKQESEMRDEHEKRMEKLRSEHKDEMARMEKHVERLIAENNRLHEEKYQITREVIPLLIELIQKLNKDG
jgi:mannitol-1-phosphate/altronate dehydrogenase